jgi:hypothetical protein
METRGHPFRILKPLHKGRKHKCTAVLISHHCQTHRFFSPLLKFVKIKSNRLSCLYDSDFVIILLMYLFITSLMALI